jgi:hypothetical protein
MLNEDKVGLAIVASLAIAVAALFVFWTWVM